MNIHKNARLTYTRRLEMVQLITQQHYRLAAAAALFAVSVPTVRKWFARYLAHGEAGLLDRSSRPKGSPRALAEHTAVAIVELRRRRLTQARIAKSLGVSKSSVSRVLQRAGLSKLSDLQPTPQVVRYEHEHPGALVHIDTKKLARIEQPGHRIHGDRHQRSKGAGWEVLYVAIDDHARLAFTQLRPDERADNASAFLKAAIDYYRGLGVHVQRVLTDNGPAFHSAPFAQACTQLNIRHRFTRPYRPQTNGKAERFIQSALREWAYGIAYNPLRGALGHALALDSPLQLAPPPPRHRRPSTYQSLS